MNSWHGAFWNLFQAQDQSKFLPIMIDYLAIASFAAPPSVWQQLEVRRQPFADFES